MDDFEWSVLNESKLFEAMVGHKPIGVNKHFEMACIWEKMQDYNIEVPSEKIWSHLETMYNLESLEDVESLPFPNDEREFYLPELEFGAMKVKKEEKIEETPKSNKEIKKEEKFVNKKDNQRRDSKDGKELKMGANIKKDVKKEIDKSKLVKSNRSSVGVKEEEKNKTPKLDEALKRQNKRPTRGSTKPEETGSSSSRKSQSPLTVTPSSVHKRRRLQ